MKPTLLGLLLFSAATAALAKSPLEDKGRPVATTAALSPAATAAQMKVPPQFRVELIAGEPQIVQPIAYTLDDRGRIWLIENTNYPTCPGQPKDRILVLEDTKGNGQFDRTTVFWDKATFSSGIAVGFGGVWLGSPPNLLFIPIQDGDQPKPAGAPQIVLDGWGMEDTHETLNDFTWGPDGWLYGTQGIFTPSRVGKPGMPAAERVFFDSGVWRYHPQKKIFERWCEGGSNQWGVDWNDHGEAFFEACVIPHMWHAFEGARYQRQSGPHADSQTYEDIKTIAWGRYEKAAYCGAMVYLGGAFPPEWRDTFFFHDIHMNKLRCEQMTSEGSSFRSERKADFLVSPDPWFRGLSPQYGPDGGVFINDWYDRVPCHQQREFTDRSNGRMYKVVTDAVKPVRVDLSALSDADLVAHQLNSNDWYVRHARRILQERGPNPTTTAALEKILFEHPEDTRQLRALWALHVQHALSEPSALQALNAKSDSIRAWTITCVCESGKPSPALLAKITEMASKDASALVRRRISSATQRFAPEDRWAWLEPLSAHAEDDADRNLPLLHWFGLEPSVAINPSRALAILRQSPIRKLPEFIARRITALSLNDPTPTASVMNALCDQLAAADSERRASILKGLKDGLKGQTRQPLPTNWEAAYSKLSADPASVVREDARKVALIFGSQAALDQLRIVLTDPKASTEARQSAMDALAIQQDPASLDPLLQLAHPAGPLRAPALRALAVFNDPRISHQLAADFTQLNPTEQQDALRTLVSRPSGVTTLLAAIDSAKIPRASINAPLARAIQGFKDPSFDAWLEKNWGSLKTSNADKQKEIARFKKFLSEDAILQADVKRGRDLFRGVCAACHNLFGTGGQIGPHLPGQFKDVDYLLQNILDPNAAIGKDYQLVFITTTDGVLQSGIITAEDANAVTLKTLAQPEPITIPLNRIKSREVSPNSMMPEGLLNALEEPDVRSLFLYLRQAQEIP